MTHPMLYVFLVATAFRITRLITKDAILDRPRMAIRTRLGEKLQYGMTCPHCVSVWVSAALVFGVDALWVPLPLPGLWFGAVAGATSVVASVTEALDG
jgi:hypothetical protein